MLHLLIIQEVELVVVCQLLIVPSQEQILVHPLQMWLELFLTKHIVMLEHGRVEMTVKMLVMQLV